jgi:hypothetical protein
MKGIVIKDLLTLKSSMKTVVLIVILFGFMGAKSGSAYMSTFASVYAAILPMTCMAFDERSRFNRYAVVMPVNSRDIVLSKYVVGLILAVAATVVATAMTAVAGGSIGETVAASIAIPMVYHSILLPLMFKFGVEKSRIIILAGVVVPAVGISFLEESGRLSGVINALDSVQVSSALAYAAVVLIVIYTASVLISLAVCKNKEW